MLLVYGVIVVFVLYVFVTFYAPTKRSGFVVEVTAETSSDIAQAQTATIKQAIAADQATTAAVDAKIQADQATSTAAAHASDIHTMAATDADTLAAAGAGRSATATSQLAANEAKHVLAQADKDKRKAALLEKKALIEQKRLEQKQMVETAKTARMSVPRPTEAEKARLLTLSSDEQVVEKTVALSQQDLIQDQISAKKADIDVLRAQLIALDDTVDTIEPPTIGTKFSRYFR